ncbi:MAG: T9SS type A sorting domain-containing protein, partial [Flavobacteriales bacterium]|nr:T9SS type A sorting domain-containing protein [Flavobacteriales bacterium]
EISIAPMPSTGEFFIFYKLEGSHEVQVTIRDLMGREVIKKTEYIINEYKQDIDMSVQPKGMYFVDLIIMDDGAATGAGRIEADRYYMLKIILE